MGLKIAIIGAGLMGREHSKVFAAIPGVELVGIFSRTRSKSEALASEFGIRRVCDSLEELFEHTKPDIAVIAVYETSMRDIAIRAFDYDATFLLEKPAGYNLAQAEEILKAAKAKNRKVYVGLNRRLLSSNLAVAEYVNKNSSERRFVTVHDQQSAIAAKNYGHADEVVNNWMYANSIHLIDYITHFCRGNVKEVTVCNDWQPNTPCILNATVKFDSGDEALYQAVWEMQGPWAVEVYTPSRRWSMRPLEKASYQTTSDRTVHSVEQAAEDIEFKPGFMKQAQELIKAHKGENNLSTSLEDAIKTMQLINTIYKI